MTLRRQLWGAAAIDRTDPGLPAPSSQTPSCRARSRGLLIWNIQDRPLGLGPVCVEPQLQGRVPLVVPLGGQDRVWGCRKEVAAAAPGLLGGAGGV